jgi:hypothetical protein
MTDVANLNDSRHIATHILENAQPEQVRAICYYARILNSGTGEFPFAVIRAFILAIVDAAPPAYARFVCSMDDTERTLFDNAIAKAVLMSKRAQR